MGERSALPPRDQLWFHHPEIQGRLRKAEADVVEGRIKVTRSAAEAQTFLDSLKSRRRHRTR